MNAELLAIFIKGRIYYTFVQIQYVLYKLFLYSASMLLLAFN